MSVWLAFGIGAAIGFPAGILAMAGMVKLAICRAKRQVRYQESLWYADELRRSRTGERRPAGRTPEDEGS